MDSTGERFEAIRAALADRNNILTVKDLCELAGVSRSGSLHARLSIATI